MRPSSICACSPPCIGEMPREQESGLPPTRHPQLSDVWTVSVSWALLKTRPVQTGHIGKYLNEASAYSYKNSVNNRVVLSRARFITRQAISRITVLCIPRTRD